MNFILSNLKGERAILISGGLWVLAYFSVRAVLEANGLAGWLRIGIALIPILPFATFLWLMLGAIRQMEELHLRVQLEALAIAFPLAMVLLMTLGLVGQAADWSYERHVWHYLPVCYFAGLFIAWKRYQ
jgi:hypothetical protein